MKSYVIQYNAAECSFRNEKEKEMFVVCCLLVGLHEVRPLLYIRLRKINNHVTFSIEGIYFLIFSLNLEENTFFF